MANELTPTEARELLGAYALDALDSDERRQVEAHLLTDADARAELHALQLGAAWLEQSSERPSEDAWGRIAAQLDDEPANVVSLAGRRTRAPGISRTARIVGIAAAIVAVLVVVGGVRSTTIDDANVADAALAAAPQAAADTPGATTLPLRDADGNVAAKAIILPAGGGIVTADLPTLSDRRTYELWALTEEGPVSLGQLGRDARTRTFRAGLAMHGMAVTDEPARGSPRPTGPVVARGELSTA